MWRRVIAKRPDIVPLVLLVVLWLLFFWRVFTPNGIDQVSLREGDFSGQFVSWTSYAVERFSEGELPLWNPYMNAGAPFLADPQTAVFYPLRLLTIAQLALRDANAGHDVYAALQLEMTVHVLLAGVFMYAFLRALTREAAESQEVSILASFIGAVVFAFGGYLSAYPQLQLPIMESAIWAPLVFWGIFEATRYPERVAWRGLMGAALALTLSVLAGHPQTFVLLGYAAVAYLLFRLWGQGPWRVRLLAIALFGILVLMLSAVQLLPTFEFQMQTYRQGFSFEDKSNGLAAQDIVQVLFPSVLSEWSPLYIGISGFILLVLAVWLRVHGYIFWAGLALVALVLSFGRNLALYSLLYVILPGYSFFRGQERAAFLVVIAAAVLVALGALRLFKEPLTEKHWRWLRWDLLGLILICASFAFGFFFLRLQPPDGEMFQDELQSAIYATVLVTVGAGLILHYARQGFSQRAMLALVIFLVFDLFSINLNNPNFEAIPAEERLPEPAHIAIMQNHTAPGQHIEGLRGVRASYGALYRVPDIWGDSPLRLDAMDFYLWRVPIEVRWELLGVQVVNSEWEALPVPHRAVGEGIDLDGRFTVYQLTEPRPFAHLIYNVDHLDSDATRRRLNDLSYPLRERVILEPGVDSGVIQTGIGRTDIVVFEPEYIEVNFETSSPAVLSLALPYTSGWRATIDGESVPIIKAYDGLAAVLVEAGEHRLILRYQPWSVMLGLALSLFAMVSLVIAWLMIGRGNLGRAESD